MRHPDPDDLALFAGSNGADLDGHGDLSAHLTDCPVCRAEVDAFRYMAELVRDDAAVDALPAPGPHVWDAIAAELGFTAATGQAGPGRLAAVPDAPVDAADAQADLQTAGADVRTAAGSGDADAPVDLAERRRRRSRWLTAAAALVVGAALGAGAIAVTDRSEDRDPSQVEATAALDPLPDAPVPLPTPTAGQAELVSVDGAQRVVVSAPQLPAIPGAYEVWLFGADGKMVSLGSLHAGQGDFTVPQGIDTAEYRTVDISDEPADGNPTHSGASVVRGTFS